jgi:hypothetical protein
VDRLLEKRNAFDPCEEYLADLIRASEPVVVSPARQQRLLTGVLRRQQTRRPMTARMLRPAFVLGVLSLAGATTAAATIGRRVWTERRVQSATRSNERLVLAAAPQPKHPRKGNGAPAPSAIAEEMPPAAPAPAVAPTPRALRRPSPSRVASRARAIHSEDPSRVVDAIQALRTDHDPVRAGRLLSEYLARYPHGALAEEAVALSIEAAAARHSPAAAAFAERYLRQYPNGRFRRAAEQALEQTQN